MAKQASVLNDDKKILAKLDAIAGATRLSQQRDPSWFHPFPARLPLAVASHLVSSLTEPGAVVLDPMVGSGTTLIASRQLDRKSIGFDRDYLAVRIARCASHSYDSGHLEYLRQRIENEANSIARSRSFRLPEIRAELPREDRDFIRYWFPPNSQRQLFALAAVIGKMRAGFDQDFAWIVFSSLIIAKSAGASHALDIARSRPHKRIDKPVIAPLDAWSRRFRTAAARIPFLDTTSRCSAEARHGDARALTLNDNSVDLVLSSPPYRNAIDYLRCHKFSLVWMGHEIAKLRELRGTMVGTERGLWSLDGLPQSLELKLRRADAEPRQVAVVRQYLSDLLKIMAEMMRVLRPRGLAALVVGPTMINNRRSDAAQVFQELACSAGFKFIGSVQRSLDSSRRSLPAPQSSTTSVDLAKRMRREIVLVLRKQ